MAKNLVDERSDSIIDAVSYWLGYQFKIGRQQLIHEASLRYPIADTITSQGTSINRVVLEKLHPIFKGKKIDLVIYDENVLDPDSEENDEKLKEVFEFKLAKRDTGKKESVEHQRVFDDVVRLSLYHQWSKKDCYFLMCGKYDDFKTYFIGQKNEIEEKNGKNQVKERKSKSEEELNEIDSVEWQPDGNYKDWFGFNIGDIKTHEFKITNPNDSEEWGLQSFKQNYPVRKKITESIENAVIIKTTCLAITSSGIEKTRTHAAGIWKIE